MPISLLSTQTNKLKTSPQFAPENPNKQWVAWGEETKPMDEGEPVPDFFTDMLDSVCKHCGCIGHRVWRNFHQSIHTFDLSFRHIEHTDNMDGELPKRCSLKLSFSSSDLDWWSQITMPVLSVKFPGPAGGMKIKCSLVYHIRSEGNQFVTPKNATNGNKEHMFAFIQGPQDFLLTRLIVGMVNISQGDFLGKALEQVAWIQLSSLELYGKLRLDGDEYRRRNIPETFEIQWKTQQCI